MAVLATTRLILRQFQPTDADALSDVFSDAEVMRYGIGPQSPAWVRNWIRGRIEDCRAWGFGLWAIVQKSTGELVGYGGLGRHANVGGREEIEIGYRLARKHWGCGYATEAAAAVLGYGLRTLRLQRIVALIDPANSASIRVAEKIGLRYEKDVMLEDYDHPDRLYATETGNSPHRAVTSPPARSP